MEQTQQEVKAPDSLIDEANGLIDEVTRLKAVNEALLEALKRLYAPKTTRMMISRPQCQRGRRLGAPSLWPRRSHER